jgi:hypothetical protein
MTSPAATAHATLLQMVEATDTATALALAETLRGATLIAAEALIGSAVGGRVSSRRRHIANWTILNALNSAALRFSTAGWGRYMDAAEAAHRTADAAEFLAGHRATRRALLNGAQA